MLQVKNKQLVPFISSLSLKKPKYIFVNFIFSHFFIALVFVSCDIFKFDLNYVLSDYCFTASYFAMCDGRFLNSFHVGENAQKWRKCEKLSLVSNMSQVCDDYDAFLLYTSCMYLAERWEIYSVNGANMADNHFVDFFPDVACFVERMKKRKCWFNTGTHHRGRNARSKLLKLLLQSMRLIRK